MSPEDRHRESQLAQHQAELQATKLERFRSYDYLPEPYAILAFQRGRLYSEFFEAEFQALIMETRAHRYDDLRK